VQRAARSPFGLLGHIVANPSLKVDCDCRRVFLALQGEIAGAYQMAHNAVADRTVRHCNPKRLRQRCACTRLAASALKRVTSGGSRLGDALPSVVADPWFDVASRIIRLG
jgi:hypothetical protein